MTKEKNEPTTGNNPVVNPVSVISTDTEKELLRFRGVILMSVTTLPLPVGEYKGTIVTPAILRSFMAGKNSPNEGQEYGVLEARVSIIPTEHVPENTIIPCRIPTNYVGYIGDMVAVSITESPNKTEGGKPHKNAVIC